MRDVFSGDVNNSLGVRNVYGGSPGATVGTRAGASTPYTSGEFGSDVGPANVLDRSSAAVADMGTPSKRPLFFWLGLVVILIGLMFLGRKVGSQGGDFANIKVTAWNTLLVTLMAIIGINAAKAGTAYVNIPGLTPLIHAT